MYIHREREREREREIKRITSGERAEAEIRSRHTEGDEPNTQVVAPQRNEGTAIPHSNLQQTKKPLVKLSKSKSKSKISVAQARSSTRRAMPAPTESHGHGRVRWGNEPGPAPSPAPETLGPPKRGVSKPTFYHLPSFPLCKTMPSCLGQWSSGLQLIYDN